MKITKRTIYCMNRIECFDFYFGLTLLCMAHTGWINACIAASVAGGAALFVFYMNKYAEKRVEK